MISRIGCASTWCGSATLILLVLYIVRVVLDQYWEENKILFRFLPPTSFLNIFFPFAYFLLGLSYRCVNPTDVWTLPMCEGGCLGPGHDGTENGGRNLSDRRLLLPPRHCQQQHSNSSGNCHLLTVCDATSQSQPRSQARMFIKISFFTVLKA